MSDRGNFENCNFMQIYLLGPHEFKNNFLLILASMQKYRGTHDFTRSLFLIDIIKFINVYDICSLNNT